MAAPPIVLHKTNEAELRQQSDPVPDGSRHAQRTISDLKDTLLHHENGIGLAGPHIGVHQRVIVVCFGAGNGKKAGPPIGITNPVIIEANRELPDFDGCLSLPDLYAKTVRPHFIRLQGIDDSGEAFRWTLDHRQRHGLARPKPGGRRE